MTNHPPSVLWYCWLGHQTCKNRRPCNLYCVGADVKTCSINQYPILQLVAGFMPKILSMAHHELLSFLYTTKFSNAVFVSQNLASKDKVHEVLKW